MGKAANEDRLKQCNEIESRNTRGILANDIQQGCQHHLMGKHSFSQQMVLGKLDIHIQKMKLDS